MSKFKVGDLVTPNTPLIEEGTMLSRVLGETYTVVDVDNSGDLKLDRPIDDLTDGWVSKYWMLAKSILLTTY